MDMPGVNKLITEAIATVGDLTVPTEPLVRLWDGDWHLKFTVTSGWRLDEPGVLVLPLESPVARWLLETDHASFRSPVHLSAEHGGWRWHGWLDEYTVTKTEGFGDKILCVRFEREILPQINYES